MLAQPFVFHKSYYTDTSGTEWGGGGVVCACVCVCMCASVILLSFAYQIFRNTKKKSQT